MRKVQLIAFVLCVVLGGICHTEAATKRWSLRYVKGAPSSEYKEESGAYVVCTSNTISMTVDSLTCGAKVILCIGDKNCSIMANPGQISAGGFRKGKKVYCFATFEGANYGNATNSPSGRIIY